ncbi:hypothetical protein Bca52824_040674 [Brassica carinata]|uniref:Nudix hydrolase n=1 Tax=Brassica carinata TaxID=52824 RepID=A0A8X7RTH5_BRACI|nr:hypothetical protein Bca52824_040674 [Brassica carinata]
MLIRLTPTDIKLSSHLSSLVDSAIKRGFTYQHAENEDVVLIVLVVQEIGGRFKGTGVWKLPTGVIQEGEDIWTGAVREVEEETGVLDANQPFNQKKEMFRFMGNICLKRSHEKEKYTGFSTVLTKKSAGKESYLYCSTDHANLLNGKCDQASTSFFTTLVHKCFCFT